MKLGLSDKGYIYLKKRIEESYKLNAMEGSPWKINAMENSTTYVELKRLIEESFTKKMRICWSNCPNRNTNNSICRKSEGIENVSDPNYDFPCRKENQKNYEDRYHVSTRSLMEFLYNKKMRFQKGFLASCFLFIGEDIDEILKVNKLYFDTNSQHSTSSLSSRLEKININSINFWKVSTIVFLFLGAMIFLLRPASNESKSIRKKEYIISFEEFHKATAAQNWEMANALTTENWKLRRKINNKNDFLREYRLTDKQFFIAYDLKGESPKKDSVTFWACYAYANEDVHMPKRDTLGKLKLAESAKLNQLINLTSAEIEEKISVHYVTDDSTLVLVKNAIANLSINEVLRQEVADIIAYELDLPPKIKKPEMNKFERMDRYRKVKSQEKILNTVCHLVGMVKKDNVWRIDSMRNPNENDIF